MIFRAFKYVIKDTGDVIPAKDVMPSVARIQGLQRNFESGVTIRLWGSSRGSVWGHAPPENVEN